MSEIPLREAGDLPLQVRRDSYLRPSGLRPVHLVHCRQSGTGGDSATFQPRDEGDEMDGDRSVVDGRDILESKLQAIVRDAFATGYLQGYGRTGYRSENCELYCRQIQEVVISYLDGPSGDVGAQDETSEEGEMGDGVRSEDDLTEPFPYTIFICKGYTGEYNLAKCETLLEAKKISDICNRMLFIQGYGYTGHDIQKYRISVRDSKSRYVY